jgi:diaminohydroxyphosphoribosylaminopyrimidine deaminase/5-amino-6-(5-phosphoribosylamino)uracil reductase
VTVLVLPEESGRVSLRACLERLGTMGVTSVLVEGGAEVNASALRAGLVDRVCLYVAPFLMGGHDAKGLIGGPSPKRLADSIALYELAVQRLGSDLKIDAKVSRMDCEND